MWRILARQNSGNERILVYNVRLMLLAVCHFPTQLITKKAKMRKDIHDSSDCQINDEGDLEEDLNHDARNSALEILSASKSGDRRPSLLGGSGRQSHVASSVFMNEEFTHIPIITATAKEN